MRIVLAGAHGQIARRLGRLLTARGDTVVGIIRNPAHESDVVGDGVDPVVLDLETARPEQVEAAVRDADAVVFAAGAGPGSGIPRKDTVDRGAAVLLADAAERSGVTATCSSPPWAWTPSPMARPQQASTRSSWPTCAP